tara:strand:+ start:433 stop:1101 length:669 start_codon:yes stop_codon:yes gene_type:complete
MFLKKFLKLKENKLYYEYRYTKFKNKFKILDQFNLNYKSIILDFGSNVGDVSKYLYEKYKSNIYSYEPNIHAYNIQKKRFAYNKKIHVFNKAIDVESTKKSIYFHKNSLKGGDVEYSHASSLDANKANVSKENSQIVNTISVSEILKQFNQIDLVKIDIEGYEYKILPVLIDNRHKIKKIIAELHGSPYGKKTYKNYKEKYFNLNKNLQELNLVKDWFIEWK